MKPFKDQFNGYVTVKADSYCMSVSTELIALRWPYRGINLLADQTGRDMKNTAPDSISL